MALDYPAGAARGRVDHPAPGPGESQPTAGAGEAGTDRPSRAGEEFNAGVDIPAPGAGPAEGQGCSPGAGGHRLCGDQRAHRWRGARGPLPRAEYFGSGQCPGTGTPPECGAVGPPGGAGLQRAAEPSGVHRRLCRWKTGRGEGHIGAFEHLDGRSNCSAQSAYAVLPQQGDACEAGSQGYLVQTETINKSRAF